MDLKRHVSFVDCPGHDTLMATMLTGAAVMDTAMMIIASNMECPQPQTREHLAAVEIMQLNNILILQNKIDLIFKNENAAQTNYQQIKKFVVGTRAELSPVVPISAQNGYNIDYLLQYLCEYVPMPMRDLTSAPQMMIIRSFDINRPGSKIDELKGGVIGGSILKGVLKVGDDIEIRPGFVQRNPETGQFVCTPLITKVVSLKAEENDLLYAIPGGLIAVGTLLDPSLTKDNRLVGSLIGHPGALPDIYQEVDIEYYLLNRLVGVMNQSGKSEENQIVKLAISEELTINIGSTSCLGKVVSLNIAPNKPSVKIAKIALGRPACASPEDKVTLSRKFVTNWRLIGWGTIKSGRTI